MKLHKVSQRYYNLREALIALVDSHKLIRGYEKAYGVNKITFILDGTYVASEFHRGTSISTGTIELNLGTITKRQEELLPSLVKYAETFLREYTGKTYEFELYYAVIMKGDKDGL